METKADTNCMYSSKLYIMAPLAFSMHNKVPKVLDVNNRPSKSGLKDFQILNKTTYF